MKPNNSHKNLVLKTLREIPGVGPSVANDLYEVGIRTVGDLKGSDPGELYARICLQQDCILDRCLLYVMRCAVYYATATDYDPELLKWWNWSDTRNTIQ